VISHEQIMYLVFKHLQSQNSPIVREALYVVTNALNLTKDPKVILSIVTFENYLLFKVYAKQLNLAREFGIQKEMLESLYSIFQLDEDMPLEGEQQMRY
jgi:hypothetical protein